MDSTEHQVFSRAMAGYERARLTQALVGSVPILVLPLVAYALGGRGASSLALGLVLWAAVVALAWRGRAWGMSVPAGILAGLFPLAFALAAQRIGHVCTPQGCTSLCVPMCTAGGTLAGLVLTAAARRSASPLIVFAGGSGLSLTVGALGCACVGASGMIGMGLGLALSAVAALVTRRLRSGSRKSPSK